MTHIVQWYFLGAATGLRASELVGLKWIDIDFDALQIYLKRSVVQQVVGNIKTAESRKPIPLDASLAEALLEWRRKTEYSKPEDWLFASPEKAGMQPYWPNTLLTNYGRPAAVRCGIQKQIGWHTFRHSYATLLKANGEDIKVVQEALRHANSRITMDTYTQAVTSAKRQAQSKVVEMIMPTAMAS